MNVLALLRPTRGVMPTLAPGGKTGSAANAEEKTVELAATIRATAAKYRRSFMEGSTGFASGRSVGPTMQLGISDGILESCGHDGVVPVGPLLAVLMSLQPGRMGVRSTVTFRYVGHFAGFCPLSGLFLGRFQRPNTAPPSAAAGALDGMPHGCAALRWREPRAAFDQRPCRFLNATGTD